MTNRDAQLKDFREYLNALQEAEKKKPKGSWYEVPADDGSGEASLIYNPAEDSLEIIRNNDYYKIPGTYLKAFKAALDSLLEEKH
jgi:hypothetical protein